MNRELLTTTLAETGEPSYRAGQVWEWVARGARSYEEMTNLPAALRERLAAAVPLSTLSLAAEAKSDDGTVKALFHTADGRPIEAVLMRYRDGRRSVCLSSQSGCPLTCSFCATGQMKFGRNLGVEGEGGERHRLGQPRAQLRRQVRHLLIRARPARHPLPHLLGAVGGLPRLDEGRLQQLAVHAAESRDRAFPSGSARRFL